MAAKTGFEFPLDHSGQWDGFNEPGMEHFSGSPFEHLGREIVQNSMDARLNPNLPVRIEINLVSVETDSIPGIKELKNVMKKCQADVTKEGNKKARVFFERANELLSEKKIKVLQVADFNTTGVAGPCENGNPYFAFMKATGQSRKTSDSATGSFGIGKFAPYTVSGLRTVFITTVWEDPKTKSLKHYVQGKSILMSHSIGQKTYRGTGFWGMKENCMPVEDTKLVESWLRREQKSSPKGIIGTTLSILGFEAKKNWQEILTANIVENFFGAIYRGNLVVAIDGRKEISRDSLPSIFEDNSIIDAIKDQNNEPEKFQNVQKYVTVLAENSESVTESTEQRLLGLCELKILIREDYPKRVAVLRNGMLITEELAKLKRFTDFKEFAAVLECVAPKGNALLREMEPPRHDDFEPDRLSSDKERRNGRLALTELAKWVRDTLQKYAQDPASEVTEIDELAEFFGDETEEGSSKPMEENPQGHIKIRARRMEIKRPNSIFEPTDDDDDDEESPASENSDQKKKKGDGNEAVMGTPTGSGKHSSKSSSSVLPLQNVRAIPLGLSQRRIIFTAGQSRVIKIQVQDSGADTNRKLNVISSSVGLPQNGEITNVSVAAGARNIIDIELDSPFDGTLRVVADAI